MLNNRYVSGRGRRSSSAVGLSSPYPPPRTRSTSRPSVLNYRVYYQHQAPVGGSGPLRSCHGSRASKNARMHAYTHTHTHACAHTHTHTTVARARAHTHARANTHTHTLTHTRAQTHTHTPLLHKGEGGGLGSSVGTLLRSVLVRTAPRRFALPWLPSPSPSPSRAPNQQTRPVTSSACPALPRVAPAVSRSLRCALADAKTGNGFSA